VASSVPEPLPRAQRISRDGVPLMDGARARVQSQYIAAAARRVGSSVAQPVATGGDRGYRSTSMGLRLRLILILTVPLVLVLGGYGFFRVWVERAELLEQERRNVAFTTKAVQIAVENALRDRNVKDIQRLVSELVQAQEQIDRIRIFDREMKPTLISNSLGIGEEVPAEALRRVIESGVADGFYRHRGRTPVLYYVAPIRRSNNQVWGAIEIVRLASAVEEKVRAATRDVWLRLAVLLVSIAGLTAVVLQRQVLQPLTQVMEGIRRLGEGRPAPALPIDRRDELGRLALAFNEMAQRLEAARLRLLAETERAVDLERQLRQAETLTVAGKLASGVAHEVGTPLNIISGRAELLLTTLPATDPRREDAQVIVTQIDRIAANIRSLLELVQPQAPEIQPVALSCVVAQLLPLMTHAVGRRGITLNASVSDDLPKVLADPAQLQQVLINVLMNALDATPAGGRVRLTAAHAAMAGRSGVAITINDTGSGIAADVLPRVFDAFFTTKPRGQGTGLGLAICRDIMKEHGGTIRIESRAEGGTTVEVWLPEEAPAA
jgi:two-component system, NtrC family, sensor kinase